MYEFVINLNAYIESLPVLLTHIISYLLAAGFFIFVVGPLHNFSKGFTAKCFGDYNIVNRRDYGYNPDKSFEWVGMVSLLLLKIGFTGPVNYKKSRFYHPFAGTFFVSLSGPISYFLWSLVFAAVYFVIKYCAFFGITCVGPAAELSSAGSIIYFVLFAFVYFSMKMCMMSAIFNLIPMVPLDMGDVLMYVFRPNWVDSFRNNQTLIAALLFIISFLSIGKVGGVIDSFSDRFIGIFDKLFRAFIGIF